MPPAIFVRIRLFTAFFCMMPVLLRADPVIQTVFFDMPANLLPDTIPTPTAQLLAVPGYPDDPTRLTFIARLYLPDPALHGTGPYPVVMFLHGSGGMWSNDTIPANMTSTNAPASQFRDWGDLLVERGYACLFTDSYNPRGIPGNFEGRRPHYDPTKDDSLCSPNYERPKDVVAALTYLVSRPDIDRNRVALIAFSQGAQTGMNSLLDTSVDLGTYQLDYVDLVEDPDNPGKFIEKTIKKTVPSPVRIPESLPIPKFCAFYYGGGSHYGYHGSASSTAAGRYMMDRRTTAILFHGTGDSLMGVSDQESTPRAGTVYPIKQVLASAAQAATLGLPNPIVRHFIMDRTSVQTPGERVGHSFDLGSVVIADEQDWDTANESPDQKARRLARGEVLRWLDFKLGPTPSLTITSENQLPGQLSVIWPTRPELSYLLEQTETLTSDAWQIARDWTSGNGYNDTFDADSTFVSRKFFRLRYQPVAMPVDAPENEGFFLTYADFGL